MVVAYMVVIDIKVLATITNNNNKPSYLSPC